MEMKLICRGYDWQYSHTYHKTFPKLNQFPHQSPNLICRGYIYQSTKFLQEAERVSHRINWRYLRY